MFRVPSYYFEGPPSVKTRPREHRGPEGVVPHSPHSQEQELFVRADAGAQHTFFLREHIEEPQYGLDNHHFGLVLVADLHHHTAEMRTQNYSTEEAV